MNKLLNIIMICIFTLGTIVPANANIIHYENRPGKMIVKFNTSNGIVLANFGSGKYIISKEGKEHLYFNTDTVDKIYLNSYEYGNILSSEDIYFPSKRATLYIMRDGDGIIVAISVTLKKYSGFIHGIEVMDFLKSIKDNLTGAIDSAEEALEKALQSGADGAVQEAALAAAIKEFSSFELSVRNYLIGRGISEERLSVNGTYTGTVVEFPGYFEANYRTELDGSLSQVIGDGIYAESGIIDGEGEQANIKDPSK